MFTDPSAQIYPKIMFITFLHSVGNWNIDRGVKRGYIYSFRSCLNLSPLTFVILRASEFSSSVIELVILYYSIVILTSEFVICFIYITGDILIFHIFHFSVLYSKEVIKFWNLNIMTCLIKKSGNRTFHNLQKFNISLHIL